MERSSHQRQIIRRKRERIRHASTSNCASVLGCANMRNCEVTLAAYFENTCSCLTSQNVTIMMPTIYKLIILVKFRHILRIWYFCLINLNFGCLEIFTNVVSNWFVKKLNFKLRSRLISWTIVPRILFKCVRAYLCNDINEKDGK